MVDEAMLSSPSPARGSRLAPKRKSPASSRRGGQRLQLLDLPGEVLSLIAAELPFGEVIPFLSLHSTLLSLTRANLSPFPTLIRQALDNGPPYPRVMAKLPSLESFQEVKDGGNMYLPILVRARPHWILERFEWGKWNERIWKEAFHRRFLRSWEMFKNDVDSWRAIFLRLEHRYQGCTHNETWTRFITLHRNGSASLNRIYSRTFDPYEIYDELKHQNNFSSQPTQVRVLLHLQDVRILAVGVLYAQPTMFANPNAHLLLHPPLLRTPTSQEPPPEPRYVPQHRFSEPTVVVSKSRPAVSAGILTTENEAYYPSVPSISSRGPPTTAQGLAESSAALILANRRSTFSGLIPKTSRRTSHPAPAASSSTSATISGGSGLSSSAPSDSILQDLASGGVARLGARLTQVRSREEDRPRRWSFGRSRSGSSTTPVTLSASDIFPELRLSRGNSRTDDPLTPPLPTLPELSDTSLPLSSTSPPPAPAAAGAAESSAAANTTSTPMPAIVAHLPTPPHTPPGSSSSKLYTPRAPAPKPALPYPRLLKPQPALSHSFYPNHTPAPTGPLTGASTADGASASGGVSKSDFRKTWEEVDDDFDGALWASGEDAWPEGRRMAEWDKEAGTRKRWVGPMIIVAQLFPCDRTDARPPNSAPTAVAEGPNIDLGAKGMYASLGLEDLDAIMPWVQLRGGGAFSGEAKRAGLGYDAIPV